jgi:hypothetical protein
MDTTMLPQNNRQNAYFGLYTQPAQMGAYTVMPHGLYPAQPPTLYSNGPAVMTPTGSPRPATQKPTVLLDTDFDNTYYPSTPPLSTSGSTVGSPKSFDALQTPMNPMFSGIDESEMVKEKLEPIDLTILDWSSCGSPPMTPVYLESHLGKTPLNVSAGSVPTGACPSLSPSPAPYARSVTSELDVDFCDPRNLTVSAATVNSTLAPEAPVTTTLADDLIRREQIKPVTSQPAFDFNPDIPDGLPSFEELSYIESEEDFVNSLVHLSGQETIDSGRPRACTGSSVVSLGHGSFIGDDLSFEDDNFQFPTLPSPPSSANVSFDEDSHRDKRVKKAIKTEAIPAVPIMTAAATESQSSTEQPSTPIKDDDMASDESNNSSGSDDGGSAPAPAPANRRGRKQSLTEDPSKTFVCDLCNRRFRRQEHLKRHYRSLHTQEKPFECNECGKKFSRSDNLAQHARTHGSGAIVMNLVEEGEVSAFDAGVMPAPGAEDYSQYGKVLFQIASEVPGSSSDLSDDGDSKKKRKRAD